MGFCSFPCRIPSLQQLYLFKDKVSDVFRRQIVLLKIKIKLSCKTTGQTHKTDVRSRFHCLCHEEKGAAPDGP